MVSSADNQDLDEGVTYYVKPSQSSQCPCRPCETMQYYCDNVNTTLNQQKNITMIFLTGNHAIYSNLDIITVTVPVIRMIGESEGVRVQSVNFQLFDFLNNTMVVFQNLKLFGWLITIQNLLSKGDGRSLTTYSKLVLSNSKFHDAYLLVDRFDVRVRDCTFINTPLNTRSCSSVILSGTTYFTDTTAFSAIRSYLSNVTLSGTISFVSNSALSGGAIALYLSTLNIDANTVVTFLNNTASQWGGAIYMEPGTTPSVVLNGYYATCFYQLLNCSANSTYIFAFEDNSATYGGDDIYGISLIDSDCSFDTPKCNLTINRPSYSNSSISSDPLRVCICDDNGKPQCENLSYTYMSYRVYPGEIFTLPLVLVGGDFGLTIGTVYTKLISNYQPTNYLFTPSLSPDTGQVISNISTCTKVRYSLYSQSNSSMTVLFTTTALTDYQSLIYTLSNYDWCNFTTDSSCFLNTPFVIDFTILPCPPGFTFLDNLPRCDCYPVLTDTLNVTCNITKGTGYFSWVGDLWMNIRENDSKIIYDEYCPYNYCNKGDKKIDLFKNSNSQCDFNRAGRLCGECKDGYSLAIGSSNCILCQTSNNLALIIFFAAAGFLLVFFIGILNITITQGTINGLIFYANIVWTYKDIFFTQLGSKNAVIIFLKTFIAWINLDFGIETCFVQGLNAFWKTWLQFVFPFYMWAIAGLIIVATRRSTRLTYLLGNRAVPLLATLFLLSYMKLLRTVVSCLEFSVLSQVVYTNTSKSSSRLVIWSVDGSLAYFEFPHILLFVAGLFTLLFLWMPYTLLLFLMQWLRTLPQRGLLKWVMQLHPFYDAYFAPLKHKHHYWLGALLLARGILLVTFISTFAIPQDINLLLLLIFGVSLLYYVTLNRPYKSSGILVLQSSYLVNLIILSGFIFFTCTQPNRPVLQSIAVGLSAGFAFLQFCGTVLHAVIIVWCCQGLKPRPYELEENNKPNNRVVCRAELVLSAAQSAGGYRDSIFNESEPLLPTY